MAGSSPGKPLVAVSVFLFGKPAWEVEGLEGSGVTPQLLGEVAKRGQDIQRRLGRAGQIGTKLLGGGWEGVGLVYELDFYKMISLKDAEEELSALGIKPGEVSIRVEVEGSERDSSKGAFE